MTFTQTDSDDLRETPHAFTAVDTEATIYDVIIVGGGPAGLTAAIYTLRAGLNTLVIQGDYISPTQMPGGQLMLTPDIDNYPGFFPDEDERSGMGLIEVMQTQAASFGGTWVEEQVVALELEGDIKSATTLSGTYRGKSVILATGAIARRLGLPNEDSLFGHGVSSCATCDGAFFADEDVVVVGGGDTAVEDALYMAGVAKSVTLIHRRSELRAVSPTVMALRAHPKVRFLYNTEVMGVLGEDKLSAIQILNNVTEEVEVLPVTGLFIAIGHDPATEEVKASSSLVKLDGGNFIVTSPGSSHTSIPGVFAAGDVADPVYRQAITAAATGCMAAIDALRFVQEHSG